MAVIANKTFPLLCFGLGIMRNFHPLTPPCASHYDDFKIMVNF